ncbi:hypothetical protein ACFQ0B_54155 [Nonomuraea thailandensis]
MTTPTPKGRWRPWLFALPALAVYTAFLVYPALSSLWFSFTDWDGLSPPTTSSAWTTTGACSATRWCCWRAGTTSSGRP